MVKITVATLAGIIGGLVAGAGITYAMAGAKKTRIYVNTEFYTYATTFFNVHKTDPTYNPLLDVNKDGIIDNQDLYFFSQHLDTWVEL